MIWIDSTAKSLINHGDTEYTEKNDEENLRALCVSVVKFNLFAVDSIIPLVAEINASDGWQSANYPSCYN
jgi:hypothetical protein